MKKLIFALAAIFGCTIVSHAQTQFIATLQHEGAFTHFYGAGALKSAYDAAETGDIITLSPGTFTSPGTIQKGITLRGAGIEAPEKTFISNNTTFISDDESMITTVEGIWFNTSTSIQNATSSKGKGTIKLIKNYFTALTAEQGALDKGPAVRLYNCQIHNSMLFYPYSYPDFLFYNCYVQEPLFDKSTDTSSALFRETTTTFINCVISYAHKYSDIVGPLAYAYYLNFYNSIFTNTVSTDSYYNLLNTLPSTATCYNCLSINSSKVFSSIHSGGNNMTVDSAEDVFTTFRDAVNEGETFELTDAAKKAYIGTDGTQIGMQGGYYPYSTTVQYPIITKFSADSQTDKKGILNIEVEVDGK